MNITLRLDNRLGYVMENSALQRLSYNPTVPLRRAILASQNADALSDADLMSHIKELRRRKLFSLIALSSFPASLMAMKYNFRLVLLSLVPSYYLYQKTFSTKFLNGKSEFTHQLQTGSEHKHLEKVYKVKEMFAGGAAEMWNMQGSKLYKEKLTLKDWMARNEYR